MKMWGGPPARALPTVARKSPSAAQAQGSALPKPTTPVNTSQASTAAKARWARVKSKINHRDSSPRQQANFLKMWGGPAKLAGQPGRLMADKGEAPAPTRALATAAGTNWKEAIDPRSGTPSVIKSNAM